MAYAKINKSGCVERHGNVQVRIDFYLEPTDPRYNDTYIDVPVLDKKGEPTGKTKKQLNPFHSHFIYFSPEATEAEILKEAEYHLPNFYTAFQNQWDKYKGGMRHGWDTATRVRPARKDKTLSSKDYEAVRLSCEAKITKLTEASTSVNDLAGREYPATEIDIGSPAINRNSYQASNVTCLLLENTANDTGVIDTVEIWADTTLKGTVVGTLYLDSGTDYIGRDYESLGTVNDGKKQTFTGLDIDVETGDYIGSYATSGRYERSSSGYAGTRVNTSGNVWSGGSTSFGTLNSGNTLSIYGTGETTGTTVTPTTASLELTTYAPTVTVTDNKEVVPEIAELELTPYPPEALTPQTITPGIAELVLEAFAPGIELTILATPGVAALALTSFAPSIQKTNDWLITPGVAALEFTLYAPSLTPGEVIRPGAASLVLTTYAPGIVVPVSVTISVAELELTRYAPGVTATDNQLVTPGAASLVLTTYAPGIVTPVSVAISVAELELTRYAPGVTATDNQLVTPGIAELVLTAYSPSIGNQVIKTPLTAELELTTYIPSILVPSRILKILGYTKAALDIKVYVKPALDIKVYVKPALDIETHTG